MLTKLLSGATGFILSGHLLNAQPITNPTAWGPDMVGIQMSIEVTNTLLKIRSDFVLRARIRNSSTNDIAIGIGYEPVYAFNIELIDSSGKSHEPNPAPGKTVMGNRFMPIRAGKTFEEAVPIFGLNPGLHPGHYKLRAKRRIFSWRDGKVEIPSKTEIISNSLDVDVE